jgi:hypothetical protein
VSSVLLRRYEIDFHSTISGPMSAPQSYFAKRLAEDFRMFPYPPTLARSVLTAAATRQEALEAEAQRSLLCHRAAVSAERATTRCPCFHDGCAMVHDDAL